MYVGLLLQDGWIIMDIQIICLLVLRIIYKL